MKKNEDVWGINKIPFQLPIPNITIMFSFKKNTDTDFYFQSVYNNFH